MAGRKGIQGRKRKPTALKVLHGTFRPDRAPKAEAKLPVADASLPPPKFLEEEAAEEWRRLAPELANAGLLTVADLAAFTAYCQAWANYRKALAIVKREGRVTKTANGNKIQHPAVGMLNSALEMLRKLAVEFGCTPSAKAGVEPHGGKDPKGSQGPRPKNRLGQAI